MGAPQQEGVDRGAGSLREDGLAGRVTFREPFTPYPGAFGKTVAMLQPLGDFLVYRNLWGSGSAPPLSVILRKRFLNTAMLDYSGEIFFYFWAQARLKLPPGMLIHAIKDSNVLSAGAGLVMVWIMALMLLVPLAFTVLYTFRAVTEERHMSEDEDYRAYCRFIAQHGLIAILTRRPRKALASPGR